MPKVSILMIVKDEESTLEVALASLQAQTFQDWECVIVDDFSSDSTPEILAGLRDPRFLVHRSEKPLGRGAARRKSLSLARGEYIGTLDGDDFYCPQKLERQVAVLDSDPELSATVTGMLLCTLDGKLLGKASGYWAPGLRQLPNRIQHLRIPFAAVLYRAEHIGENQYDQDFRQTEDQQFFSKLLLGRRVSVTPDHLYVYRWVFEAEDVISGLRQSEKLYSSTLKTDPFTSLALVLYTRCKRILYRAISQLGLWETFKRIRYHRANASEKKALDDYLRLLASNTPCIG